MFCFHTSTMYEVQSWVGGHEGEEFIGVGARFGPKIVSKEKQATREPLTLADPIHGCTPPKINLNLDMHAISEKRSSAIG
ncbi:signal peptide peptidase-like 5 [Hordeum vulgare subsp. vulgare]|uniref:signal peptide peptidase-like 5 n=1 Tax=Hordeum vulgare subsp. vulgare TaxID=112509 RepID=UPI001D1A46A1|nr:signal peptide peptidase-like 5 [Hordeum vulgare subsp. vulgare]